MKRLYADRRASSYLSRVSSIALAGMALLQAQGASAQTTATDAASATAQPAQTAAAKDAQEIVVTGSRIVRDGYKSPTPLMVLGRDEIENQSPTNNLADLVNETPALAGSVTPGNSRLSLSSGTAGINALNLRDLGTSRTLVLLDGRRTVGSTITGAVDVNDLPQALVRRVEIVTGGASATYGSDAVSGVVNFILDEGFEGLKGSIEDGITNEGDGHNYRLSLAGGAQFAGGRGHLLLSGEYEHTDGINSVSRDWNLTGYGMLTNPDYTSTNGQPLNLVSANEGRWNVAPGGVVRGSTLLDGTASTLLRGTLFGQNGALSQFNFGSTTNTTDTIGGDWQLSDLDSRIGLAPSDDRRGVFGRLSYELTDSIEVYAEGSYYWNHSSFNAGPSLYAATLTADNPYVINTLGDITAEGLKGVTVGTSITDFPYRGISNTRNVHRYVLGAKGDFEALGSTFHWDAYGQQGIAKTHEKLTNIMNNARMALALDAVYAPAGNAAGVPAGTIVCRSTLTDPGNGCVPLDILGSGVADPAATAYVLGNPDRHQTFKQTVAAINLSFDPFSTWAGSVSIATGGEYRRESVDGHVDDQYQSGWQVGNYLPTIGHYDVKEAYLEALVPLGLGFNFNGAVRATDYSTSGYVTTWKLGLTFQPIPDVLFRATRSRDIRAPNLSELYQAGTSNTDTLNDPFNNNKSTLYLATNTGNPNLKPEISNAWNAGVVIQPRFLPGFSASVDGFDIKIRNAIGSVGAQTIVNRCYKGLTQYCSAITRDPGGTPELFVSVSPFNFAYVHARGLDFSTSYTRSLGGGMRLHLNGTATYYDRMYTNDGIDVPYDAAGANGDGVPSWIYRASATLDFGSFSITGVGRGVSAGTISNRYVVCSTNCPASTVDAPTVNYNHVDGEFLADLNLTKRFDLRGREFALYLNVTNLFDRDPPLVPVSGLETNPTYYDYLGRTFRVGFRFDLGSH